MAHRVHGPALYSPDRAVLPHLPAATDRLGPEAARRLNQVRQELLRAQARAVAEPTTVTLKGIATYADTTARHTTIYANIVLP